MLAGTTYTYVGKYEDGRVAVRSGSLRQVRILSSVVSSTSTGTGRTVCVYKLGGKKKRPGGELVECYVRGAKTAGRRRR